MMLPEPDAQHARARARAARGDSARPLRTLKTPSAPPTLGFGMRRLCPPPGFRAPTASAALTPAASAARL